MITQSNVSKETQEISDDNDVGEEEDIQKKESFLFNLSQCLTK